MRNEWILLRIKLMKYHYILPLQVITIVVLVKKSAPKVGLYNPVHEQTFSINLKINTEDA
jgi:hypothetical protein